MKKDRQLQRLVKDLLEISFSEGKIVEKNVVKAIKLLKSLPLSKSIFAMSFYVKGLKRKERQHTMYIETAVSLSSATVNKMRKIVEKKTMPAGRQVKITKVLININPEILGGFKLRIGDEIWDESILGKIGQVKEAIRG